MKKQYKGEKEGNSIVLVLVGVTLMDDQLLQSCAHIFTPKEFYFLLYFSLLPILLSLPGFIFFLYCIFQYCKYCVNTLAIL